MSQKPSDVHIVEILAVHLFTTGSNPAKASADALMEEWRDLGSTKLRDEHRARARSLMDLAEAQGIQIKVADAKKVNKAVSDIITIPARPAYTLEATAEPEES